MAMELRGLNDLDRDELLNRWRSLYELDPPASISKPLLTQAVAYRMQEEALGGLKPATQRFLMQFLKEKDKPTSTTDFRIGTQLLREWRGTTYEVTILENGVILEGKRYGSLSEVARIITGNRQSGPLFFGLRKKAYG
jgi:hypothetical protein